MKKKIYSKKDVEKIIALGRQKGYLTYDEINDLLPEEIASSEDIDQIFELLGNEDIELVDSQDDQQERKESRLIKESAVVAEQPAAEERFMPLDDPVKMYLKQMGSISLLSRENEIELAKRIEEAEEKFKRASLTTRYIRREILGVAEEIIDGDVNFDEVVKGYQGEEKWCGPQDQKDSCGIQADPERLPQTGSAPAVKFYHLGNRAVRA